MWPFLNIIYQNLSKLSVNIFSTVPKKVDYQIGVFQPNQNHTAHNYKDFYCISHDIAKRVKMHHEFQTATAECVVSMVGCSQAGIACSRKCPFSLDKINLLVSLCFIHYFRLPSWWKLWFLCEMATELLAGGLLCKNRFGWT